MTSVVWNSFSGNDEEGWALRTGPDSNLPHQHRTLVPLLVTPLGMLVDRTVRAQPEMVTVWFSELPGRHTSGCRGTRVSVTNMRGCEAAGAPVSSGKTTLLQPMGTLDQDLLDVGHADPPQGHRPSFFTGGRRACSYGPEVEILVIRALANSADHDPGRPGKLP